MSTEYYTQPPIEYSVFLAACPVEYQESDQPVYTMRHVRMYCEGMFIWALENANGEVEFERFGRNVPDPIFKKIQEKFGVKIIDEYSLYWNADL